MGPDGFANRNQARVINGAFILGTNHPQKRKNENDVTSSLLKEEGHTKLQGCSWQSVIFEFDTMAVVYTLYMNVIHYFAQN